MVVVDGCATATGPKRPLVFVLARMGECSGRKYVGLLPGYQGTPIDCWLLRQKVALECVGVHLQALLLPRQKPPERGHKVFA